LPFPPKPRESQDEVPWNVPVPVVQADFTPLHATDAGYAVRVDLGRMGPFGFSAPPGEAPRLLYSDLQINADGNAPLRLGSGRAGFLEGKYLKGVGRTLLAANWSDAEDGYHNSGHLLASAAAREYLVSCYLERLGAGDSIVACEGLLLAPLPSGGASYVETLFARRASRGPAPVDRSLQAITVKGAGFARLSNFVWAFVHWKRGARHLADLFLRMTNTLGDPTHAGVEPDTCGPSTLAELLDEAIARTFQHFVRYFQAGVYWGSFHNNFTADGRFLDLETPLVFGGPFVGILSESGELPDTVDLAEHRLFVGFEVLHYLRQVRTFVGFMRERLEWLSRNGWEAGELERTFLRESAEALRERFSPAHLLYNLRALEEKLAGTLFSELAPSPRAMVELEALIDAQCRVYLDVEPRRSGVVRMRPVEMRLAAPEPTFFVEAAVPDFLEDFVGQTSAGRAFNAALCRVDEASDVATALHRLREAEAALIPSPPVRSV
jgi:hypothetical protein